MSWTKDCGANYHQQDTDYYCGGATAQMILDSIGAGLLDQTTLYNSNHSHNQKSGWSTDPEGLRYTLNAYKPSTFNNHFVIFSKTSEKLGSEKIVYTIWKYNVATGTLVYGTGHWIVVRGVTTDVEPILGSTYSINGFYINNPWPYCPSYDNATLVPPPPHTNGTDGCGGGGNRGIANEYVVYDPTWKDTYLTGGIWNASQDEYISICDPEIPKFGTLVMKEKIPWSKKNKILTPTEVQKFLTLGIKAHEIQKHEYMGKIVSGCDFQEPILVQRLDKHDSFYFLVPLAKNNRIVSVGSIDGLLGYFRGIYTMPKTASKIFLKKEEVIKNILGKKLDLGKKVDPLFVRPEAFCLYPTMVWRPCRESRSPYYPFYMISVGDRRLYVGYDGTIYPSLTDLQFGG